MIKRLWPFRFQLWIAAIPLAVGGLLPAVAISFLEKAIDAPDPSTATWAAALFAAAYAAQALLNVLRALLTRRVAQAMVATARQEVHQRLLMGRGIASGPALERALQDADELAYAVSAVVTLVRNPLVVISLIVVAARLAPYGLLPAAIAAGIGWLGLMYIGRQVRRVHQQAVVARNQLASLLADQFAGSLILQWFHVVPHELRRAQPVILADGAARGRWEVWRALPTALTEVYGAVVVAAGITMGAADGLQTGDRLAFLAAMIGLVRPIAGLVDAMGLWERGKSADLRMTQLNIHSQQLDCPVESTIIARLNSVSVERQGVQILDQIDFTWRRGEWIGIRGASGIGKTTLVDVLLGNIPAAGRVEIQPGCRIVPQNGHLFERTVIENVDLGRGFSEQECRTALQMVGWSDAERQLGAGGVGLSGGERQRVALARAILGDPLGLILDEPTSAMDVHSEQAILSAIKSKFDTVLLIAHREQALQFADRILILEHGQLKECPK